MATLNKEDVKWLAIQSKEPLSKMEVTLLEMQWDAETDWDVEIIKKEVAAIKKVKRMCLLKLFTFIPEAFVATFISTKKENQIRRSLNNLYFKFLFNKVDYNTFKKELLKISKEDIILI